MFPEIEEVKEIPCFFFLQCISNIGGESCHNHNIQNFELFFTFIQTSRYCWYVLEMKYPWYRAARSLALTTTRNVASTCSTFNTYFKESFLVLTALSEKGHLGMKFL